MRPKFEWDNDKALKNFEKHRISFDEAKSIFDDPEFITVVDEEHSDDEERYIRAVCKTRLALPNGVKNSFKMLSHEA